MKHSVKIDECFVRYFYQINILKNYSLKIRKFFITVLTLIVGTTVGYRFFINSTSTDKQFSGNKETTIETIKTDVLQQKSVDTQNQKSTKISSDENLDISKPIVIDGVSYMLFTKNELAEIGEWLSTKGYIGTETRNYYENYSDAALKELAKKGDLAALDVLSTRALKAKDVQATKRYLTLSAIYGSTGSLMDLIVFAGPSAVRDSTESTGRPKALEASALSKLLSLRGDEKLASVTHEGIERNYKLLYNVDLVLTPEEQQKVDARAQAIYDQLQHLRNQKGLGDFDNSVTDAVKRFQARP